MANFSTGSEHLQDKHLNPEDSEDIEGDSSHEDPKSNTGLLVVKSSSLTTIKNLYDELRQLPMTIEQKRHLRSMSIALVRAVDKYGITIVEAEEIGTAIIEAGMSAAGAIVKHLERCTPAVLCCALDVRKQIFGPTTASVATLPVILQAMEDSGFPEDGDATPLDYDALYHEINEREYSFQKPFYAYEDSYENGHMTKKPTLRFKKIHAHDPTSPSYKRRRNI